MTKIYNLFNLTIFLVEIRQFLLIYNSKMLANVTLSCDKTFILNRFIVNDLYLS